MTSLRSNFRAPPVMAVTPLRRDRAVPGAPQYRMEARGKDRAEIYLYGLIGLARDNFFGVDGVTAKQFADDLKKLGRGVRHIDLRINSDGGVIDDARAIHTLLVQHPAEVTTHIDSIAASAASFVAMAGKTIRIAEGGFVMIHNARGGAYGQAEDLERYARTMRDYNQAIRNTYHARTGQPDDRLRAWMDEETWFSAAEAVEHGFADEVMADMRAVACLSQADRFEHLPEALRPNRSRATAALAAMRGD